MGPPASVHIDLDGESIWAFIRCDETSPLPFARGGRFGVDCMNNDGTLKAHDTIYKFDAKGNVVKSFGAQMFIWPHGLHVDREGNIWATNSASQDAVARAAKAGVRAGHIVRKFSPDGKVLMTLGEPGVAGNDESHFNAPAARRDRRQRGYFRRGRPRPERPHREVLEGRQVHQVMGQDRLRAGRIPGRALYRHGQARPAVRVRSLQRADPDLRSGREVHSALAPIRDAERDRVLDQR